MDEGLCREMNINWESDSWGIVFLFLSMNGISSRKTFKLVKKHNKIKKNVFFSCTSVAKILGNVHRINENGGA